MERKPSCRPPARHTPLSRGMRGREPRDRDVALYPVWCGATHRDTHEHDRSPLDGEERFSMARILVVNDRRDQVQLDEHRRREATPIVRSRAERLLQAERRMAQDLEVERLANEAYERYRAHGRDR